jgi:hypothetical protein
MSEIMWHLLGTEVLALTLGTRGHKNLEKNAEWRPERDQLAPPVKFGPSPLNYCIYSKSLTDWVPFRDWNK